MLKQHLLIALVAAMLVSISTWLAGSMFMVIHEFKQFQQRSWDESPWALSQGQLELERMRSSVLTAVNSPTPQNLALASARIEIFWSRLDVIKVGPNKSLLLKDASLEAIFSEISLFLQSNESKVYNLDPQFAQQLAIISSHWSKQWQSDVVAAYVLSTKELTDINNELSDTFNVFIVLLISVFVLTAVLCTILMYLLLRNQRLLARSVKMSQIKDEFLANMSHELRTPLNGIVGTISLLKQTQTHSEESELIDILEGSSEALMAQINDVLDYSQIEAGQLRLEYIDFSLGQLLKHSAAVFTAQVLNKGIEFDVQYRHLDTVYVKGDMAKIRQVILNLIANAVKFTHHGKISLSCNIQPRNSRELVLTIMVKDTGIGIEPAKISQLFQSFTQADSSIKRKYGGSGLGLSISKKLVKAMGGKLLVESVLGRGSVFNIQLMLKKADNPLNLPKQQSWLSTLEQKHILLAEDNPVNQTVAKRILESLGMRVSVVDNGQKVLDYDLHNVDLILMDIQMPVLDGIEATKKLRLQGLSIPIVALTANATKVDQSLCIAAGMNEFISKPFKPENIDYVLKNTFLKSYL